MSANKTKDILSLLQSRIALRANFLSEYAPSGATDWHAVEDQKADKKAIAEIVRLRREVNSLSNALDLLDKFYEWKNAGSFSYRGILPKAAETIGYTDNSK